MCGLMITRPFPHRGERACVILHQGNVEASLSWSKGRQRRSLASARHGRRFAVFGLTVLPLFSAFALTYDAYAPRVKTAAAFPSTPLRARLDGPFGKRLRACFFDIPSRCEVNRSYGGYVPHGVNYSTAPPGETVSGRNFSGALSWKSRSNETVE